MKVDLFEMQQYMTADTALSLIRLWRDALPRSPALVVEGGDDLKLFNRLTVDSCIVVVAGSRDGVIDAARKSVRGKLGLVLGVVDRDYTEHRSECLPENVVLTDLNDLEMMMLVSPAVDGPTFEGVGCRVRTLKTENGEDVDLASFIAEKIKPLGQLRVVKHEHLPELSFRGLRLRPLLNGQLDLDPERLLKDVVSRTPGAVTDDVRAKLEEVRRKGIPATKIARGHDAVQYLCILLESGQLGTVLRKLNENDCGALLRAAYRPEDFAMTELGRAIRAWCTPYGVSVLLA